MGRFTKYQPIIEGLGSIQNQPSCLVYKFGKVKEYPLPGLNSIDAA